MGHGLETGRDVAENEADVDAAYWATRSPAVQAVVRDAVELRDALQSMGLLACVGAVAEWEGGATRAAGASATVEVDGGDGVAVRLTATHATIGARGMWRSHVNRRGVGAPYVAERVADLVARLAPIPAPAPVAAPRPAVALDPDAVARAYGYGAGRRYTGD
jgi:hypothetical protein